jgi:hypothetical protein
MSRGFRWALGIVVVATAAEIGTGVRSQVGTGGLWLTVGRELTLQAGDAENTERALVWVLPRLANNRVALAGRRPADLGLKAERGDRSLARAGFVVLTLLNEATTSESRLVMVDAGVDHAALAERYPDRDRYLIIGGSIARWQPDGTHDISFHLSLVPSQLHLPTELPLGRELLVRSGRGAIPFIVEARP